MNLAKEQEAEILKVHDAYWDNYLKGNVQAMRELLAEGYTQVGSAEEEDFFSKIDAIRFLRDTIDQVAGKLEMRNRRTKIEQLESLSLVHERCDLYAIDGSEWIFYARFRASSLMQKANDGWKIIHQHSSFPDIRAGEGENVAIEKVARENIELRDAIKRRTIELRHKNRELEIEAALERVRSRSLAMHHASELQRVIHAVHEELLKLKLSISGGSFIAINSEIETEINCWGAGGTADTSDAVHIPRFEKPFYTNLLNGLRNGPGFFTEEFSQEEKIEFFTFLFQHEPWSGLTAEQQSETLSAPGGYTRSCVVSKHTSIFIINHFGEKFSPADNEILKRFGKVFEQTYTRFLDLQKAEAQVREAQIEIGLERVRAKAMAMHASEDLATVVNVVFEELEKLSLGILRCGIGILSKENHEVNVWITSVTDEGKTVQVSGNESLDLHPLLQGAYAAWLNEVDYSYLLEGEDMVAYYQSSGAGKVRLPDSQLILSIDEIRTQHYQLATFAAGGLFAFGIEAFSDEAKVIMKRFALVFNQSYTRFLDLQKAEAQAREAKIEVAVERVRAKALAMHKSEDLHSAVVTLKKELTGLQIPDITAATIYLAQEDGSIRVLDLSDTGGDDDDKPQLTLDKIFRLEETDPELWIRKMWERNENYFVLEADEDDFVRVVQWIRTVDPIGAEIAERIIKEKSIKKAWLPTVKLGKGILNIDLLAPPGPEIESILLKMGAGFDLAYKRFLDLQKAEAQAREAEIELALERVRARTMAMQHSQELLEVATVLFQQVKGLGVPQWNCGFNIWEIGDESFTYYPGTPDGIINPSPCKIPLNEHPVFRRFDDSRKKGIDLLVYEKEGEEQKDHYEYMLSLPGVGDLLKSMLDAGFELPTFQIDHLANFAYGNLIFITYKHFPEMHTVFKRFAKVFEQTYTRFLDLQKAESQAREAQIEAALERVRSKAMAMHASSELSEVVLELRNQMGLLGASELETCAINLYEESVDQILAWSAIRTPEMEDKIVEFDFLIEKKGIEVIEEILHAYASEAEEYLFHLDGSKMDRWLSKFRELAPTIFEIVDDSTDYSRTGTLQAWWHCAFFKGGALIMITYSKPDEASILLLKRFSQVFGLAYRRFSDLQKAEAQAREATKQASVDRVRGEIASMRSAADLELITPLIFRELTILGVPFIRCGVFIIREKEEIVEAYLSSPDGNSLGVLRLPFQASDLTLQTVEAWRKGLVYRQHWNKEDFVQWINQLMEQDQIQDSNTYQGSAAPPESLDLHFVPFTQGMLYVGTVSPLDEGEIELVQSLTKAFSIAFARYEDFVKLEQAKAEVESAMTELKATQSQLVQQEKLASLGQLTAGIAHEIKNPLNFINNFSEVNLELVDEIREERSKSKESRDETLVSELLDDIRANLEKVHEHGTRADQIVKSMLQHSRSGDNKKALKPLNPIIKEFVNLAYHGMRASKTPIEVAIDLQLSDEVGEVNLISEDFSRVVLNLCNNGFDAMREKMMKTGDLPTVKAGGGPKTEEKSGRYEPQLTVSTKLENGKVVITFEDNGPGIPDEIKDKIMQPFFTTKKGTEGTGLGLSITNDIIKAHGGEILVNSNKENGSVFKISLPVI